MFAFGGLFSTRRTLPLKEYDCMVYCSFDRFICVVLMGLELKACVVVRISFFNVT